MPENQHIEWKASLRESVLNAIAHKDYGSGVPIQISVYDDRIMLWNPGPLPSGWTVERLTEKHPSQPYNPDVANAFFRAGMIEAWGRGIERIMDACREAGTPTPVLEWDNGLWVTFPFLPEHSLHDEQRDVAPEVTPEVTPEIIRMLAVIRGDMARREIQAKLGLSDEKHFREAYQQPAVDQGLIEMTIPDKPRSRLQKYRLTDKGRAILAAAGKHHE